MKNTVLSICLVLISLSATAQTRYQPLVFQSPEVSLLTNEVKTPVSLSSGTVAIEVPLYTIKEGDINVPISLAYDGSGVKVNSQPTWVGQNWSLRAGGMISRIVKGAPDETYVEEEIVLRANGKNHVTNKYSVGVQYNRDLLQNANWNSTSQIESWAKTTGVELEPDEFIFNFCGHAGKFYMDTNGKFTTLDKKYTISGLVYKNIPMYDGRLPLDPNKPASFTFYKSNMMSNGMGGYIDGFVRWRVSRIMGFCITDDTGMKYYFGSYYKDETGGTIDLYTDNFKEIEITADFFSQFFEEEFSTWHLERIVSPKGDSVEFKYEIGATTVSFSSGYSMSSMSGSAKSGIGWIFGGKVSASNYFAGPNMSGKFIRPVHLSEIRTANESIKFDRSTANTLRYDYNLVNYHLRQASEFYDRNIFIPVYAGQLPIVRYDSNGKPYLDASLLKTGKLDRINVKSLLSGQTVKEYAFSYEEGSNTRLRLMSVAEQSGSKSLAPTTFAYNTRKLPAFFAEQYDHWGYYNGKAVSQNDYASAQYYQKREPDPTYANAEILEKITYSLGGSKTILYEPNRYDRVVVRNTSTGALSISPSSPAKIGGGLRVKQIVESDGTNSYTTAYTYSPGILNGEVQYYWGNYQGKLLNGNTYSAARFMTSSLLPVSNNSDGGSVSYSDVTESRAGNGRTEYSFSNHNNRIDENGVSIDLQKSPYSPLSSRVIERGKLLESRTYKEGGTSPIKKEKYVYSILDNKAEFIPSVYLRRLVLFGGYPFDAVEGTAYKIYTYPYNVTKMTDYFYGSSNKELVKEHSWTYDSHNQTSSYTMRNSDDSHKVTYKRPYDYPTAPYSSMVEKNMISPVIEETTTVNNVKTKHVKVDYTAAFNIPSGSSLPASVTTSFLNGTLPASLTFNKYDSKGHLLQATDQGGIPICYIWGYGGDHVVAEIKNATLSQITAKPGLSNIGRTPLTSGLDANQDNKLREIPNASVVTYSYNPLVGVSEVKDASGRKTRYAYDAFGRLQSITDDKGRKIKEFEYNVKH